PSHTPVAINGQRTTLVGRVSMDMLTVDVTDIPSAKLGDRVEFWGDTVSATEVANACGTIRYESFCQVTSRPRRVIREEEMAKTKIAYVCTDCGADHPKWQGQCASCGSWTTLSELVTEPPTSLGRSADRAGYARVLAEVQQLKDIVSED